MGQYLLRYCCFVVLVVVAVVVDVAVVVVIDPRNLPLKSGKKRVSDRLNIVAVVVVVVVVDAA